MIVAFAAGVGPGAFGSYGSVQGELEGCWRACASLTETDAEASEEFINLYATRSEKRQGKIVSDATQHTNHDRKVWRVCFQGNFLGVAFVLGDCRRKGR